jgi:hypothetical protein
MMRKKVFMIRLFILWGCSILLLGSHLFSCTNFTKDTNRLRGHIIDAGTGEPLAATVAAYSANGLSLQVDGGEDYVNYLGKKRWYVDKDFFITTEEDSIFLEIRYGLESIPIQETIYFNDSSLREMVFKVNRWTNMAANGYYCGDTHVHYLNPSSAHLQMRAEDLHVVNILTSDFTHDREKFSGALDKVSTHEHFVYVGQELRDWQMGHLSLLRLREIIEPYEPYGGYLFDIAHHPNILLSPRLTIAKAQDAATVWSHFSNLPGFESVITIPLGLIDAIELITYDDPIQLPSHWFPWDFSGMSQVEFPAMRGMDLYYQYLNSGFNLPITAGTDKMGTDIPVGSNRHYIPISGEATYDKWIEGLKSGKGFVTNGPMLTFKVDNSHSGDTIMFEGEKTVNVLVEASSLLPFAKIDIIANGKLVSWKYLTDYGKRRDIYSLKLETEITLSKSTWIAGRVISPDTREMMPRNLTVFAHSNPIYLLQKGKSVYEKESVDYLRKYQRAARNWIENNSEFASETEQKEALDYLDKAEQVFSKLTK